MKLEIFTLLLSIFFCSAAGSMGGVWLFYRMLADMQE